jgi:Spy/CpxP family protein refolding chaperone
MLTALTLALTASLLSAQATAQEKKQPPTAPPHKLKAIASWVAPCMGVTLEGRA